MSSDDQLVFRTVWNDDDLTVVEIMVRSHGWQGTARAFAAVRSLENFVGELRAFAADFREELVFEAGAEKEGGLLRACFYRMDAQGHLGCHLMLATTDAPWRSQWQWQPAPGARHDEMMRLSMEVRTEPALLDEFIASLEGLIRDRRPAVLRLT